MALDVIRDIIIANKEKRKLLPNIADGLIDMKHMYNTVGVIGIYETLKAYQNKIDSIKSMLGLNTNAYDFIKYDEFGNIFYTELAENFVKNIFNTLHKTFAVFQHNIITDQSILKTIFIRKHLFLLDFIFRIDAQPIATSGS